ncbi:MAG: tetratricopeptide repeat protein [Aliidongia sp.]
MTEGPLFKAVMAMVEAGDPNVDAYMMAELRRRVEDPAAWADAGTVLFRLGRWAECCTCLEQAIARGQRGAETLAALGFASYLAGSFDRSAECFLSLLQEDPASGEAWRGLGSAFAASGRYNEALKSLEEAARYLPEAGVVGDRIWRLKFQFGDWQEAWRDFDALVPADIEARWQARHSSRHLLWRGEDLAGRDLVVFSHGGHGDAIQHFRWIEPLLATGPARITAIVRPALVALLNESPAMQAGWTGSAAYPGRRRADRGSARLFLLVGGTCPAFRGSAGPRPAARQPISRSRRRGAKPGGSASVPCPAPR